MPHSKNQILRDRLSDRLAEFECNNGVLAGLTSARAREAFISQIIDSERRDRYFETILHRDISAKRIDPYDPLFDPILAAVRHNQEGSHDEACWLSFLSVHCGRHSQDGWSLAAFLYQRGDSNDVWDWNSVTQDIKDYRRYLEARIKSLLARGEKPSRFGNHRKYESLDAWSPSGTGAVISSYLDWITKEGNHQSKFNNALQISQGDPSIAFDHLYGSMSEVSRFGRLGKFDFLCLIGKLGLAAIQPSSPYLQAATGPRKGAERLTGGQRLKAQELDNKMAEFANKLGVSMQCIEDALCNWQKSPNNYKAFRG